MYPSTDILIPGRFWLINRKTAEIEYNVIPAGDVRLRVAQTGQLDVPDTYPGLSIRKRGHCAD